MCCLVTVECGLRLRRLRNGYVKRNMLMNVNRCTHAVQRCKVGVRPLPSRKVLRGTIALRGKLPSTATVPRCRAVLCNMAPRRKQVITAM
jgi:hypothetical protein